MIPEAALRASSWPLTAGAERRRIGRALLAFGAAGLALLVLAGGLVIGALGAVGEAAGTLDEGRLRLVALIDPTETALEGAATTAANAGTSFEASSQAARDAASMTAQLADAMDSMASAAQVEVFGVRPFASLADELTGVATRSRALGADLATTATALDSNVDDSLATATDLRVLAGELAALRVELGPAAGAGNGSNAGGLELAGTVNLARLVLLGLLAWLAVAAVAAIWLGWRWRDG